MLAPPRTIVHREGGVYALERALQRRGFTLVAGADEAGRGACAGPLVVGAVVLPPGKRGEIEGLTDSKLLTPLVRERLYDVVLERALAWSVVVIEPGEVDGRGLHVCNLAGMRRALASVGGAPIRAHRRVPRARCVRSRARRLEGRPGRGVRRGGEHSGEGHARPDHGRPALAVARLWF
jgi:hypothetical protein